MVDCSRAHLMWWFFWTLLNILNTLPLWGFSSRTSMWDIQGMAIGCLDGFIGPILWPYGSSLDVFPGFPRRLIPYIVYFFPSFLKSNQWSLFEWSTGEFSLVLGVLSSVTSCDCLFFTICLYFNQFICAIIPSVIRIYSSLPMSWRSGTLARETHRQAQIIIFLNFLYWIAGYTLNYSALQVILWIMLSLWTGCLGNVFIPFYLYTINYVF